MNKQKKKIIIVAVAIAVIVAIVALGAVATKPMSVAFTDSSGNTLGTAEYNGSKKTIKPADEGYYDYLSIALDEAISFYSSTKGNSENTAALFFKNVSVVETNFSTFYFEKIKNGFTDTELEDDTPFASVMVDLNGRILACYGYRGEDSTVYSQFKTYAGSSIKPLSVYAPAIEKGIISWTSLIKDSPVKKVNYKDVGMQDWPQNANGIYTNEGMLVCDAIYTSTNTVAVKTLQALGIENSINFLSDKLKLDLASEKKLLESTTEDEIYGNLALGFLIDGVSPVDMAGYYQIFANGGKYTEPWAVRSVTDKQGEMLQKTPKTERVLSAGTASIMAKLLQGVVQPGGTGSEARVEGMTVAGKTGTSDGNQDNWFIGFNTKLVCSVWHGNNDDSTNNSHTIFSSILSQCPKSTDSFKISTDVSTQLYCKKSGGIRGRACRDVGMGYFLTSNIPDACDQCG